MSVFHTPEQVCKNQNHACLIPNASPVPLKVADPWQALHKDWMSRWKMLFSLGNYLVYFILCFSEFYVHHDWICAYICIGTHMYVYTYIMIIVKSYWLNYITGEEVVRIIYLWTLSYSTFEGKKLFNENLEIGGILVVWCKDLGGKVLRDTILRLRQDYLKKIICSRLVSLGISLETMKEYTFQLDNLEENNLG